MKTYGGVWTCSCIILYLGARWQLFLSLATLPPSSEKELALGLGGPQNAEISLTGIELLSFSP
jgi:hypothetical protein